ncbi:MAG: hypothetical protein LBQ45_01355 [Mycoplasmataceae bacterium]|jgi:hypothetical protein|nr:hypothetical protein [Mycoplasmataceae bacterium]
MSNKHTTIKFLDAQYKPIENTTATIAIIKHVKPKKQVKQNKKPRMTVEKLANILMEFISRQEQFNARQTEFNEEQKQFNRNIVKLNNLRTE